MASKNDALNEPGTEMYILNRDELPLPDSLPNQKSNSIHGGERDALFKRLTAHKHLDRALEKPHVTGIAISGTIGMGLFIRTGEVISLGGGVGAVVAMVIAGFMVTCVMICLSEMVSFRHEVGGIFEYPKRFVNPPLGFAVGIMYWLVYVTSLVTLIIAAAELLEIPKGGQAGVMAAIIFTITCTNMFGGVRLYGWLEWTFKWLKILLILTLCVLMIIINRKDHIHTRFWGPKFLFPPGFNGNYFSEYKATTSQIANFTSVQHDVFDKGRIEIPGVAGKVLGVITAVNVAIFGYIGSEILIVAAGETKNARRDLPVATRQIYLWTLFLYVISTILVSFNVPWNDPMLVPYSGNSGSVVASNSPFIIAMSRSTLGRGFVVAFKAFFFLAAVTTANTDVYVASRTLHAHTSNTQNFDWAQRHIGRTSFGKTPIWAIGVSIFPSLLALTALAYSNTVTNTFSEIASISTLCVYACECFAFICFKNELGHKRDEEPYTSLIYRVPRQPFWAWSGLLSCSFFVLVNGWHYIYAASHGRRSVTDILPGLIGSYFGPVMFVMLYWGYKLKNPMPIQHGDIWDDDRSLEDDVALEQMGQTTSAEMDALTRIKLRLRRIWLHT